MNVQVGAGLDERGNGYRRGAGAIAHLRIRPLCLFGGVRFGILSARVLSHGPRDEPDQQRRAEKQRQHAERGAYSYRRKGRGVGLFQWVTPANNR